MRQLTRCLAFRRKLWQLPLWVVPTTGNTNSLTMTFFRLGISVRIDCDLVCRKQD